MPTNTQRLCDRLSRASKAVAAENRKRQREEQTTPLLPIPDDLHAPLPVPLPAPTVPVESSSSTTLVLVPASLPEGFSFDEVFHSSTSTLAAFQWGDRFLSAFQDAGAVAGQLAITDDPDFPPILPEHVFTSFLSGKGLFEASGSTTKHAAETEWRRAALKPPPKETPQQDAPQSSNAVVPHDGCSSIFPEKIRYPCFCGAICQTNGCRARRGLQILFKNYMRELVAKASPGGKAAFVCRVHLFCAICVAHNIYIVKCLEAKAQHGRHKAVQHFAVCDVVAGRCTFPFTRTVLKFRRNVFVEPEKPDEVLSPFHHMCCGELSTVAMNT